MCCCNTLDWWELGRTSAWAGFHDCKEQRKNELFYGNISMDGGYGVFTGTRSIATDLAWLSPVSTIFPWIIDRQTVSFDRDGFYAAGLLSRPRLGRSSNSSPLLLFHRGSRPDPRSFAFPFPSSLDWDQR